MAWSRSVSMAGALLLAAVVVPATPVSGQQAAPKPAVAADQDGWWNRLQGAAEQTPATLPTAVPAPPAPAPGIGPNTIVVGYNGVNESAVGAVGVVVEFPEAPTVTRLVMTLREASGSQNASAAKILACPITEAWAGAKNGNFVDRPKGDCAVAKAEGVRAADGSWAFDLTAIATQWAPPGQSLQANGVLLTPPPQADTAPIAPGAPFQVVFEDVSTGKVGFDFAITAGSTTQGTATASEGTSGEVATEAITQVADAAPAPSATFETGASFDSGSASTAAPATPAPSVEPGPAPTAQPAAETPAATPVSRDGKLFGNWSAGIVLAALALLALAAATGVAMGAPVEAAARRQGGVSRALARRAGTSPAPRPT